MATPVQLQWNRPGWLEAAGRWIPSASLLRCTITTCTTAIFCSRTGATSSSTGATARSPTPFFSLRTVFVSIENSFGLEEDDPIFEELNRSYLASWRDYGTMADLAAAFEITRRLWSLSTALKYWRFLTHLEGMADEFGDAAPSLMREFLEANPLS